MRTTRFVVCMLIAGAPAMLNGCHSAPSTDQSPAHASSDSSTAMPAVTSRPLTPEAQEALCAVSRLSPENTLAWLKRSDQPPASPKVEKMLVAPINTWSQPGVADGLMRRMCFDAKDGRFWIVESGGISGRTWWYGPLKLGDGGGVVAAD